MCIPTPRLPICLTRTQPARVDKLGVTGSSPVPPIERRRRRRLFVVLWRTRVAGWLRRCWRLRSRSDGCGSWPRADSVAGLVRGWCGVFGGVCLAREFCLAGRWWSVLVEEVIHGRRCRGCLRGRPADPALAGFADPFCSFVSQSARLRARTRSSWRPAGRLVGVVAVLVAGVLVGEEFVGEGRGVAHVGGDAEAAVFEDEGWRWRLGPCLGTVGVPAVAAELVAGRDRDRVRVDGGELFAECRQRARRGRWRRRRAGATSNGRVGEAVPEPSKDRRCKECRGGSGGGRRSRRTPVKGSDLDDGERGRIGATCPGRGRACSRGCWAYPASLVEGSKGLVAGRRRYGSSGKLHR